MDEGVDERPRRSAVWAQRMVTCCLVVVGAALVLGTIALLILAFAPVIPGR